MFVTTYMVHLSILIPTGISAKEHQLQIECLGKLQSNYPLAFHFRLGY